MKVNFRFNAETNKEGIKIRNSKINNKKNAEETYIEREAVIDFLEASGPPPPSLAFFLPWNDEDDILFLVELPWLAIFTTDNNKIQYQDFDNSGKNHDRWNQILTIYLLINFPGKFSRSRDFPGKMDRSTRRERREKGCPKNWKWERIATEWDALKSYLIFAITGKRKIFFLISFFFTKYKKWFF